MYVYVFRKYRTNKAVARALADQLHNIIGLAFTVCKRERKRERETLDVYVCLRESDDRLPCLMHQVKCSGDVAQGGSITSSTCASSWRTPRDRPGLDRNEEQK